MKIAAINKTAIYVFLAILYATLGCSLARNDCSISGDEGAEYKELNLTQSLPFLNGILVYQVMCDGTVTSVRARGFCPVEMGGNTVIMRIINATLSPAIIYKDTNVVAECNTSAAVGSEYYEGFVSVDNLSIELKSGDFLGIDLGRIHNPSCSCLFIPAVVRKSSNHSLIYLNNLLQRTSSAVSLLFSANISVNEETPESRCTECSSTTVSFAIVGAVLPLFCAFVISCPMMLICLWRKNKKGRLEQQAVSTATRVKPIARRSLPEEPSPPPSVDLVQQLQKELGRKNMLYFEHHLQLTKVIGEGESGLVYRGYINSGELVAVKTGKALLSVTNRERLLKEVSIMISFRHPNVMSLTGMCFDGEVPLLIMPFMSGGSVLDYVTQNRENLHFIDKSHGEPSISTSPDKQVSNARKKCLDMCHQIAKGMTYLARERFVHRDLAARNCMIDNDGVVKVADFGLAEDMYGSNYYRHSRSEGGERVPIRWMAPESIDTNIYNEATDVWSYGVTCWEVFTCGRVPYTGVPAMTLLSELRLGHRLDRPSNITCSDEMWEMMTLCWLADPERRPKFSDLANKLFYLLDSDSSYLRL